MLTQELLQDIRVIVEDALIFWDSDEAKPYSAGDLEWLAKYRRILDWLDAQPLPAGDVQKDDIDWLDQEYTSWDFVG